MWWKSAVNRSFFLCLAACRMRSSACDTLSRFCARRVLCCPAFPLVPALGSTNSAPGCPALFVGFTATMAGSGALANAGGDTSPVRASSASAPHLPDADPGQAPGRAGDLPVPGQGASVHALTTPGRRRLALTPPLVWPSVTVTTSAPGTVALYRGRECHCWHPPHRS